MKILIGLVMGAIGLVVGGALAAAVVNRTGCWASEIDPGTYTVTSVQTIRDDVYVTIEHRTGVSNTASERLELRGYKFPAVAFKYPFKKDGTKLTVIEDGEFKLLQLE